MDVELPDNSAVTPHLVRLHDSQKLFRLAKDKNPQARAALTDTVSELLKMNLSPRECDLVSDVLIALLRQAEVDLRRALSEKLSLIDEVPLRVALQIANDSIDVASPFLKNSSALDDMDLIYIIKSKSAEYWRAIAQRNVLGEQAQNALADTRDIETALALAENKNIKLTPYAAAVLSDIAQQEERIAVPLLNRDDISSDIAVKLYRYVSQELKDHILGRYDIDPRILTEAVDEMVLDFVDAARSDEYLPNASMLKAAARFKEKGLLTPSMMIGTLKRGQVQAFIAQFSQFASLSPATVAEMLVQQSGQALAVACKAYDIAKADFTSMYLLTNRARSQGGMIEVKDMSRAISYYDQISADIARNILRNTR